MIEGLWIAQFEGLQGHGAGVVVFVNGRALGGDEAFTYVGHYKEEGGKMKARVTVSNFRPEIGNVMGITGDFDLEITAPVGDGVVQGTMVLVGDPAGRSIAVKLTKKARL
jgi:hypothetical protein